MNGTKAKLLIFGFVVLLPGMALAGNPGSSNYNLVYSDTDFSSDASVQALHAKIVRTARSHWRSYFISRALADTRSCVRDVVTNLVRVIGHPQLTDYAQGEGVMKLAADLNESESQS